MDTTSLVGKRFGRVEVISFGYRANKPDGDYVYYWKCRCDCGTEFYTRKCCLVDGGTRSCGCLRREILREKVWAARDAKSRKNQLRKMEEAKDEG